MTDEMHETVGDQRVPAREELTADEYRTLEPLMKLASIGNPNLAQTLQALKPGELKRQELKRRALDGLREHGTIGHAAAAAGVAVTTVYRWRDQDPEFARQVLEFMHVDQVDQLHQSLYHLATNPTPQTANASVRAAEFLLKAENRDKYGDKTTIDQTVTINQQVQVTVSARDQIRAQQQARLKVIDVDAVPALPT